MSDGFEPGLHMKGRGGVLVQGWNEVTKLEQWVASPTTLSHGGPGLRITVGSHTPDPYLLTITTPISRCPWRSRSARRRSHVRRESYPRRRS